MMIATSGPVTQPQGVLVLLPSGEWLDVPYNDIVEIVWPEHPCRGEADASLSDWVFSQLWNDHTVRSFVPGEFEAVARVYHPWTSDGSEVTWSTVANALGVDGRAALSEIAHDNNEPGFNAPSEGRLEQETMRPLVEVLRAATSTPDDVFFAVWEGWGGDEWQRFRNAALLDKFHPTFRPCRLLRGPIEGALGSIETITFGGSTLHPMVWWPADRTWLVHTEVDAVLTLVAGSEAMVEQLLARPNLEVTRTSFLVEAFEPD
jgi:hypothetical protein